MNGEQISEHRLQIKRTRTRPQFETGQVEETSCYSPFRQNINLFTFRKYSKAQLRSRHCLPPHKSMCRCACDDSFPATTPATRTPTYTQLMITFIIRYLASIRRNSERDYDDDEWLGKAWVMWMRLLACTAWTLSHTHNTHTQNVVFVIYELTAHRARDRTQYVFYASKISFARTPHTHTLAISAFRLRFPSDISTNRFICFEMMYAHLVTTLSSSK